MEARINKYYNTALFTIPTLVDETATAVEDHLNKPSMTSVNLIEYWTNITLHQAHLFHKYTYYESKYRGYIVSCEWVKQRMANSCAEELIQRVEEKYETLEDLVQYTS